MDGTPRLYDMLVQVFSQHHNWLDRRPLKTLAWMMAGLIQVGKISLTAWVLSVHSRAVYAASPVRRLTRWLEKTRIDVPALYGPLIQHAIAEWGDQRVSGPGPVDVVEYLLSGASRARVSWQGHPDGMDSPGTPQQQCGV